MNGKMIVKGRCWEDMVGILLANGYNVEISKDDEPSFNDSKFTIVYYGGEEPKEEKPEEEIKFPKIVIQSNEEDWY